MKKLHYFSAIIISIFVSFHLLNYLVSILSLEAHIEMMNAFRKVYRNMWVETLLLLAVLVQIVSGGKLFLTKRKLQLNAFQKIQLWSGLYLAVFFLIHISAVLAGRLVLHLDTNVYFGAAGLNTFPLNVFFIPYYTLAILSFFGHIAAIHHQKMKTSICGISIAQQSKGILMLGGLLTIFILYGLTNGFSGIEVPGEYGVLIGE
jgi:hypothetical protein